jgi:hypothetical protein
MGTIGTQKGLSPAERGLLFRNRRVIDGGIYVSKEQYFGSIHAAKYSY